MSPTRPERQSSVLFRCVHPHRMIEISALYTQYGDTPHWSLKMDNQDTLDISQEHMGLVLGFKRGENVGLTSGAPKLL